MRFNTENLPAGILAKNWTEAQIGAFLTVANQEISNSVDEDEAITVAEKAVMDAIQNAKKHAQIYYARHMTGGVARYHNEMLYVDTDTIKRMLPSFVGMPVYVHHQVVNMATLKQDVGGYVVDSFYNELDGWAWVKMIINDDAAHDAIAKGWKVSNAYQPTRSGPRGTSHNVPYDRSIEDAHFTHLGIVPDPRYERADIMTPEQFKQYQAQKRREIEEMRNSLIDKPTEGKPMFKYFKTQKTEVTNAAEIDDTTVVELPDGTTVPFAEMVNALKADKDAKEAEAAAKAAEPEKLNDMEMKIDVLGELITVGELQTKYLDLMGKKVTKEKEDDLLNSAAADEAAAAKKIEDDKKAAEIAEGKKAFDELKNSVAPELENAKERVIETKEDQVARGSARY